MARDGSEPPPAKKRGPNKKVPVDLRGGDGPIVDAQLKLLARQVIEAKEANKGRLSRGFYSKLLGEQTTALNIINDFDWPRRCSKQSQENGEGGEKPMLFLG